MRTRRRVLLGCAAAAPAAAAATASAFRPEPMQAADAAAYDAAACPAPAAHAALRAEMVGALTDLPSTEHGRAMLRSAAVCSYCLCDVMLDLTPDLLNPPG